MIVESMSYEDICREFDNIHREYFPRVQDRMQKDGIDCSKIRRFMLKHKSWKNVLFPAITYQVDNNTTLEKTEHAVTGARMNQCALFEYFCSFNCD